MSMFGPPASDEEVRRFTIKLAVFLIFLFIFAAGGCYVFFSWIASLIHITIGPV